ncbi:Type II secretion system protein M [Vibrio stylophorae]|uniref:Type II secretion system protein M n=1 Tax=Vibrio stylophorae TaxID=659351 RepID=A0ABM8ZPW4_9VIBR|nr:type II secretion system protein M [Vibrio stylophorae]CAH0532345.1 Type II secretion system protein M [Vibrio stylophorae]
MAAIKAWWLGLEVRERILVATCGGVILFAVLYFQLWQPLQQRQAQAQMRVKSEQALLQWSQTKAAEIQSLRKQGAGGNSVAVQGGINERITQTASQFKIQITQIKPQQDLVQVVIKPLPFNNLMAWLDHLALRQGVVVHALDLKRGDQPGVVEVVRLQLMEG